MSRPVDLTGKRFGALTALRPIPASETSDHRPGWLVRCDCGNEKVVNGSNLRSGRITSCGCGLERGKRIAASLTAREGYEDLTGQTYHELTAVEYLGHNYWRWRCSCGQETKAKAADVKSGRIQSCGHILAQTALRKIAVENTVEHYDGTTVSRLRRIMDDPDTKGLRKRYDGHGHSYWEARITLRRETIYLGSFSRKSEAKKARRAAEEKYYLPIIQAYDRANNGITRPKTTRCVLCGKVIDVKSRGPIPRFCSNGCRSIESKLRLLYLNPERVEKLRQYNRDYYHNVRKNKPQNL